MSLGAQVKDRIAGREVVAALQGEAPPASLPPAMQSRLERAVTLLLTPGDGPAIDFGSPAGEPALLRPDSVSWRIFRNPVSLFVGGVCAVILELAEPRVRSAVWEQGSFPQEPVRRLQRTGLAAMVTVYGPHTQAEAMIAGIRRVHERVRGKTPNGQVYRASDPELLDWVQATASFGFLEAYHRYVRPLPTAERDRVFAEGAVAAHLFGATGAPRSEAELRALFARMAPSLQRSGTVFEFLEIVASVPILPRGLRPLQPLLVRAAVDLVPPPMRSILALGPRHGPRLGQRLLVRGAARVADRLLLRNHPAVQACRRLGLPDDYLVRRRRS